MRFELLENGLRVLAPAKLNLHLEVGPGRADGFHPIDSVFQTVTLFDELDFEVDPGGAIELEERGIACAEENLVSRAARRLQEWGRDQGADPAGARIRLRKRIPQGAGLGGGSSDAAATLVALSRLWTLTPTAAELLSLAGELGSDVPFFLFGGTCRCRGRGEQVLPLDGVFTPGKSLFYVLVYPRVIVPTSFVYKELDNSGAPGNGLTPSAALDSIPTTALGDELRQGKLFFNRLESVVFSAFPELQHLRERMAREPFLATQLSGSGSTIFGVCGSALDAERIAGRLCASVEADIYSVRNEQVAEQPLRWALGQSPVDAP